MHLDGRTCGERATARRGRADSRPDYDPYAAAHRSDLYAVYARLRDESPVFYSPVMKAWVLTRYEDPVSVLTDTKRFSHVGSIGIDDFATFPEEVQRVFNQGYERFPSLIELDPPVHATYRYLVNLAFTPRRVAALEPRIRQLTDDLVDTFAADGATDFPTAFAFPLPMIVICEILGVPRRDMLNVQSMADGFRALEAGNMWQLPVEEQLRVAHSFVNFQHDAARLIEERRADPRQENLRTTLISPDTTVNNPTDLSWVMRALVLLERNPGVRPDLRGGRATGHLTPFRATDAGPGYAGRGGRRSGWATASGRSRPASARTSCWCGPI